MPLSRATRVAAGIPNTIARQANITAIGTCSPTPAACEMSHHNSTVAADAQLPGPGRIRPQPKNVAMSQESLPVRPCPAGAEGSALVLSVGIISVSAGVVLIILAEALILGACPRIGLESHFFGIGNRTGNHIPVAGPLAQIYQTTTLAAEGELGIGAQHQLLTGGATQAEDSFPGHGKIEQSGNWGIENQLISYLAT